MSNKIIIEIRAGTGGEEASIFAGDLIRMYQRYAAQKGWRFIELDSSPGHLSGYKTLIGQIEGPSANPEQANIYQKLKHESGVHRVQRVPKTEKSGRVHTSTASVAILPFIEAKEIKINPQDLEVSFFRSSGPGGQNVNKVETAVRILHKPSGLIVACQSGRNQHSNREKAMEILQAKLYEEEQRKKQEEFGSMRKEQIGSAERAEKIRTYNFPQDRITDHRINKKWHNIEAVMEGNLEPIVSALAKLTSDKR